MACRKKERLPAARIGRAAARVVAIIGLLGLAAVARAENEPLLARLNLGRSDAPVEVRADRLDFAYDARRLTYEGGVSVEQGDIALRCERLVIELGDDDDLGLRSVVAEGQVVLTQGSRRATGRRATFDHATQTVVLSGDAVLQDGPNQVTGDRVEIDLARETSVVHGGEGRVRAVLFPPTPARSAAGQDGTDG